MHEKIYHFNQNATVVFSGPTESRSFAVRHGAKTDRVCLVKTASTKNDPGYQTIIPAKFGNIDKTDFDVFADGVILTEKNSGAVMYTADCPTITLYEQESHRLILLHAGRPAMTPTNYPNEPINNIVSLAYKKITEGVTEPKVSAYVTGSICAKHFEHVGREGEKLISPFDQFGGTAFKDRKLGQLDLPAIINKQLLDLSVSKESITIESFCTYESPELESYRRDRGSKRNRTAAVLH